MHRRARDAEEEAGVSAVEPNTRERTELTGAIQEAKRARGGAVCDREEPPDTCRRWTRRRSQNPSHGLMVAGERRRREPWIYPAWGTEGSETSYSACCAVVEVAGIGGGWLWCEGHKKERCSGEGWMGAGRGKSGSYEVRGEEGSGRRRSVGGER